MPEKEVQNFWGVLTDPYMWLVIFMVTAGTIAKLLKNQEPLDTRVLVAETILAAIGAIGIYAFGVLQNYSPVETVFMASLMSLGGIHTIQRAIQFAQQVTKGK